MKMYEHSMKVLYEGVEFHAAFTMSTLSRHAGEMVSLNLHSGLPWHHRNPVAVQKEKTYEKITKNIQYLYNYNYLYTLTTVL